MLNMQENVPLAIYTTFRIGGPARYFVEVTTQEELEEAIGYAQKHGLNFFILGGGSNLLVSDQGFNGLVIKMKLGGMKIDGDMIEAEAGVPLAKVVRDSVGNSLTGLEWATGIPGTLGGAVRGNAGAYGGETKDILQEVNVLEISEGKYSLLNLKSDDCKFGYRDSIFKHRNNLIILSVTLKLTRGSKEESQKKMKEVLAGRLSKHPHGASAGSFFINPVVKNEKLIKEFEEEKGVKSKEGKLPAGWLIEKADLKGKKVGGAMVNELQTNYIINTGNASAQDVVILSSLIKQKIRVKFGVQLKEEVQLIGF